LEGGALTPEQITAQMAYEPARLLELMRSWMDEGILKENDNNSVSWNSND